MTDLRFVIITLLACLLLVLIVMFTIFFRIAMGNRRKNAELEYMSLRSDELEEYRNELEQLKEQLISSINTGTVDIDYSAQSRKMCCQRYTGIPVADSLILCKINRCQELGIALTVNLKVRPPAYMEEKYITSLLCNLLDNAIDAASGTASPYVILTSREAKGQWVLEAVNSKNPCERPLENGMLSTKSVLSGHGLGSKIIDRIVSKYSGYIKRTDNEDSFRIFITLPQQYNR